MTEWRRIDDTNVEVSNDGRVRRDGVEFEPTPNEMNRKSVYLNGKMIKLHRLIASVFIPNPEGKPCVDHVDGNPLNNCVENLRWATHIENMRNTKRYSKVSRFPRGVSKANRGGFTAHIGYDGILYHLGTYDTPEEASEIYEVTAEELFGEFYRKPE